MALSQQGVFGEPDPESDSSAPEGSVFEGTVVLPNQTISCESGFKNHGLSKMTAVGVCLNASGFCAVRVTGR